MPEAREGAQLGAGRLAGLSVVPESAAEGNFEVDERELIDRAGAGDIDAQARLFDEHYPHVYRYLRTRLQEPADAEDLAQDVFMRMLDALPRYSHRGVPFISWLMRIASNRAKDYYRERGPARTMSLAEDLEVETGDDPAEQVELQLSIAEISGAMQHLTELERDVIRLRYAAELSIAETAAALEKSENNIKQLTYKGLAKLRKALGPANA